jgi:hypothetical protein
MNPRSDQPAATKCEHDYSKGHVCLKCGHSETWGEYMKRMEERYAAYITR